MTVSPTTTPTTEPTVTPTTEPTVTPTTEPTASPTVTSTPTPSTKYTIIADERTGGIAVPKGTWELDAGAEYVISFDSRPGHVLENISVNGELLPPDPYIRRTADGEYTIVAIGRPRDQQIRVDFTAEVCNENTCEPCTSTPCRGTVPLNVRFIPEPISGTPETWSWDFGNGERKETPNTEEGKRAETQYTMPGLYTVSLTGKKGELSGAETKVGYIYGETKMPVE